MASPPPQIRRSPLRFETVTLHVDRTALDARLFERAQALGTMFLWERVTDGRIRGRSRHGMHDRHRPPHRRPLVHRRQRHGPRVSRALDIPVTSYGRQKVCLWAYFDTPPLHDGTVFFVDNRDEYLSWVWDIPISPHRTSVGFVLPADTVRDRRRAGDTRRRRSCATALARHSRFAALLDRTRRWRSKARRFSRT